MPSAAQVPDGFELVSNGTARLIVDGQIWRLRRPKLGEYRKLRELLQERDDARVRIVGEAPAPEKVDDDAESAAKVEFALAVRRRARDIEDRITALNLAWVEEALRLLADKEPPPSDDWPAGMDSGDFIASLVEHWRSVPLRSGGS